MLQSMFNKIRRQVKKFLEVNREPFQYFLYIILKVSYKQMIKIFAICKFYFNLNFCADLN